MLDSRRTFLRPKEAKVAALTARDVLANGKQLFQLLLTYEFKQPRKLGVTLTSAFGNNLYDNAFGVLGALYDKNSRLVQFTDVYGKEVELDKGDYSYRLQIIHSDFKVLEGLKATSLRIDTKLDGKAKGMSLMLYRGEFTAISMSHIA